MVGFKRYSTNWAWHIGSAPGLEKRGLVFGRHWTSFFVGSGGGVMKRFHFGFGRELTALSLSFRAIETVTDRDMTPARSSSRLAFPTN